MVDGLRKEKLSIYLVKSGLQTAELSIKQEMVVSRHDFNLKDGEARLFIKRDSNINSPPWTKIFKEHPDGANIVFGTSKNVGAVLLISTDGRSFLLSFGTGFHLIRGEMVERDFGLRVTLNAVEPDKLRSLDKASYDDNPLNSRTQSTLHADIFDLQVDFESDLVYAVTGVCKYPLLGAQITGRDALTLMVETSLSGIANILRKAFELFQQELPVAYAWIDNVAKVRDEETTQILEMLLDDLIQEGSTEKIWLGEPEIVDWESNAGYSFDMYQNSPRHQALDIKELAAHIAKKELPINLESLKKIHIHVNNSNYISIKSWSAYRCLYAEITDNNEKYILRNGIWFKVESSFVDQIDSHLKKIELIEDLLPPYSVANEGEYNKNICDFDTNLHLMDKNNVKTGGPHDKIEFCDVIVGSAIFVHVKYYRSSATLSHLFSQGAVAAETFAKDEDFRNKLNKKLPKHIALLDTSLRPNTGEYKVVYAIATEKNIPLELPFFSKVTLKNAFLQLSALGYCVAISRIPLSPLLLQKKKYKPKTDK